MSGNQPNGKLSRQTISGKKATKKKQNKKRKRKKQKKRTLYNKGTAPLLQSLKNLFIDNSFIFSEQ